MWAILLALIIVNPIEPIERCDLIELNHCCDDRGSVSFDQLIFWDWDRDRFRCVGWRFVRSRDKSDLEHFRRWRETAWDFQQYPGRMIWQLWLPRRVAGRWEVTDQEHRRRIRAAIYRETWTRGDPERQQSARFPGDVRRL